MKKLSLFILLLTVGNFWGSHQQVEALSCAPPNPVKEEMTYSTVVFKGKAVEIKDGGLAVFQVEEAWKGVNEPIFEIYDNSGWDPFGLNAEYLVFGSVYDGELRTNLCGNSGHWNSEREMAMEKANMPSIIFDEPILHVEDQSQSTNTGIPAIAVWIGGLALLLVIAVVVWRKYRR